MPELPLAAAPATVSDDGSAVPRQQLLDQPVRRRMVEAIRREPGIKISQLCRVTDAGWGTVKYHLQLLKEAGLIMSRPKGRDCLLFASDYPADELPVQEALRRGRADQLAQAIVGKPGASQKELCEQVRMTRKIIRRYVGVLQDAGLVSEQRDAQFQRYYPRDRLVEHLKARPAPKAASEDVSVH